MKRVSHRCAREAQGWLVFATAFALAAVSLTALAPASEGLPASDAATLSSAWTKAFQNAPACKGVRQSAPDAKLSAAAAACQFAPECLAHSASDAGAPFLVSARLRQNVASLSFTVAVVQATPPRQLLDVSATPATNLVGLLAQLQPLAARACDTVLRPPANAPVLAGNDLDLDLGLDAAPAAPREESELGLSLPVIAKAPEPKPIPASAPPPAPVAATPPPPAPVAEVKPVSQPLPPPVVVAEKAPAPEELLLPPIESLPFPDAPPAPVPHASSKLRAGTWAAAGLAIAASGGGAFFGWRTISAAAARDQTLELSSYTQRQSEAQRWGLGANVSWGVAATSALTAGALWWMSHGTEQVAQ